MKKFLILAASTIAMASSANAQNVASASPFAGPYVGVQVGMAQLKDTHDDIDYWYDFAQNATNDDKKIIGGLRIGYDAQLSNIILAGVLAEGSITDLNTNWEYDEEDPSYEIAAKVKRVGSVRGKLGLTSGNLAAFGTVGLAFANIKHQYRETDGTGERYDAKGDRSGVVYGFGAAYAINAKSNIGFDFSEYDFGKKTHDLLFSDGDDTGSDFSQDNKLRTLTLSYNYRF